MTCEVSTFTNQGGDMALDMGGWGRETGGEEGEVGFIWLSPRIYSKETQVKLWIWGTFIKVDEGMLSNDLQLARKGIR